MSTLRVEKFERVLVAILAKINLCIEKPAWQIPSGKIKNKTIGVQYYYIYSFRFFVYIKVTLFEYKVVKVRKCTLQLV